jgi:hypothetical protein
MGTTYQRNGFIQPETGRLGTLVSIPWQFGLFDHSDGTTHLEGPETFDQNMEQQMCASMR